MLRAGRLERQCLGESTGKARRGIARKKPKNDRLEGCPANGFGEKGRAACSHTRVMVAGRGVSGQSQDWAGVAFSAEAAGGLSPIHNRHIHIQDDQIRSLS